MTFSSASSTLNICVFSIATIDERINVHVTYTSLHNYNHITSLFFIRVGGVSYPTVVSQEIC